MALLDSDAAERKSRLREQARTRRQAQPDKDALSRRIMARCFALPEYVAAETVMFYVDVRDEVRTRHDLPAALGGPQRVVVPYCCGDRLELFHLQSWDELERGQFGILEPRRGLRELAARRVALTDVPLILVPGVAFDRGGARLGQGQGYYDRLLRDARRATQLMGLAFECQLVDEVPLEPHDVRMDKIITEAATYECRGRRPRV